MKSDREFLDGIYAKAEKSTSINTLDNNLRLNEYNYKQMQKQHVSSTKYVKYASLAACFLLLTFSALYTNNYIEKNKQIANHPEPSNFRMMGYPDILIDKATDIIAVKAHHDNNVIALSIIKSYKGSGTDSKTFNFLNNDVIGLSDEESAIVFIDADSKDAPVMDIFIWEADRKCFINAYDEIITEEILINSK